MLVCWLVFRWRFIICNGSLVAAPAVNTIWTFLVIWVLVSGSHMEDTTDDVGPHLVNIWGRSFQVRRIDVGDFGYHMLRQFPVEGFLVGFLQVHECVKHPFCNVIHAIFLVALKIVIDESDAIIG